MPDGTIYRALEKLLVLDGERISYRALDVEQIGSVYETMMGFRLETATRPLGRHQAAEESTARRRPSTSRLCLASSAEQAREVASGPRRPQAHRRRQEGRRGRPRRSRTSTRRSSRSSTATPRPTSCRRARWCCSRARSGAARARTTRRAR